MRFSKKHSGKFVRLIDVGHLRVDGALSILSGYKREELAEPKPGTAVERAMRDLLIGIISEDQGRARRGLHGLLKTGRMASTGLFTPDTTSYQPDGKRMLVHDSHAHTNYLTELEIMDWLRKEGAGDIRFLGRRVRNRKIDEVRRRTAQKRKEPPMVTLSPIHLDEIDRIDWKKIPAKPKKKKGPK